MRLIQKIEGHELSMLGRKGRLGGGLYFAWVGEHYKYEKFEPWLRWEHCPPTCNSVFPFPLSWKSKLSVQCVLKVLCIVALAFPPVPCKSIPRHCSSQHNTASLHNTYLVVNLCYYGTKTQ